MTWRSATTMTLDCFTAVRKDDRERSIFIEPLSSDEIRGETGILEEMYLMYIDDEIFVSTKKIADTRELVSKLFIYKASSHENTRRIFIR